MARVEKKMSAKSGPAVVTRVRRRKIPTPTNDPNVPGISGTYPTPQVATARAKRSLAFRGVAATLMAILATDFTDKHEKHLPKPSRHQFST
jgi:hypothetical protein